MLYRQTAPFVSIVALAFTMMLAGNVHAQLYTWRLCNGPYAANPVQYIAPTNDPTTIVMATDRSIYVSLDRAATWEKDATGLPGTGTYTLSRARSGGLYATMQNTLYFQSSLFHAWSGGIVSGTTNPLLLSVIEDSIWGSVVNQIGAMPLVNHNSSWYPLPFQDSTYYVQDLAFAPDHTLYVLSYGGNVFASTNGGASWLKRWSIPRDPGGAHLVVAGTSVFVYGRNGAGYRSIDSGITWKPFTLALPDSGISMFTVTNTNVWYATSVNSRVIYHPALGTYRSTNFGASWDSTVLPPRALAADSGGAIYVANLVSLDSGRSVRVMHYPGIRDRIPAAIIEDSTHEVMMSLTNLALSVTTDDGNSFNVRYPSGFNAIAGSPNGLMYAGSPISISTNRGRTWKRDSTNSHLRVSTCAAMVYAPDAHFYVGCREGIVYNYHIGDTAWDGPHGLINNAAVTQMVVRGNQPFAMIASGLFRWDSVFGVWQPVPIYPGAAMTAIAVDSTDQLYLATMDGKLFHSSDDGETWDSLSLGVLSNGYANVLVVNAANRMYLGCNAAPYGVFYWDPVTHTVTPMNGGMQTNGAALPSVSLLQFVAGRLYAATDQGVFVSKDPERVQVDVDAGESIRLYPNPARNEISFESSSPIERYEIMNVTGERVASGAIATHAGGRIALALSSGVYELRLIGMKGAKRCKLVVVR